VVERLRDIGCSVIMNVPEPELKRLASMIQTIIVPSVFFLEPSFKYGKCEEFIVQAQYDDKKYSKSTSHYHTKYNIYFRGCNPNLGCSILFTGSDDLELERIKECFENILDEIRQWKLGNGFERKDYSDITSKSVLSRSNFRPKTMITSKKVHSDHPHFGGELERGGFIMRTSGE